MPFFYDLCRSVTTNVSANTESTHLWGLTITNQQTVALCALYPAARLATAGGGQARIKTNSGAVASGGTVQAAAAKHPLARAADSVWKNDATAITPGATLALRMSVGFAQAGGPGGWVAFEPEDRILMMAGAVNPVDVEITSVAASASVPLDLALELAEGS